MTYLLSWCFQKILQSEELRRQINTGLRNDDYLKGKARLFYMKEDHAMA